MLGHSWTMHKFSEASLILIMWSILRFRRWAVPWMCSDCRQSPLCGTICIRIWNYVSTECDFFLHWFYWSWQYFLSLSSSYHEVPNGSISPLALMGLELWTHALKFFEFPEVVELGPVWETFTWQILLKLKGKWNSKNWQCVTEMVRSMQAGV